MGMGFQNPMANVNQAQLQQLQASRNRLMEQGRFSNVPPHLVHQQQQIGSQQPSSPQGHAAIAYARQQHAQQLYQVQAQEQAIFVQHARVMTPPGPHHSTQQPLTADPNLSELMRQAQQRAATGRPGKQPLTNEVRMNMMLADLDPNVKQQLLKVPEPQFSMILQGYMGNLRRQNEMQNSAFPPLLPPVEATIDEKGSSTIKCICGYSDDDGNTVLCETCDTWQHIVCYYESTQHVPDIHECADCFPRVIDLKSAFEKQRFRRKVHSIGKRKGRPKASAPSSENSRNAFTENVKEPSAASNYSSWA
jgi:hypothetical protein